MQVVKSGNHNKSGKGVFKAIFLVFMWFVILSMIKDTFQMRRGYGRVIEAGTRLDEVELRNIELRDKYDLVLTDEYREKLVREQLNMQKEGEVIVVLPNSSLAFVPKGNNAEKVPVWKKWFDLIR